METLIVTPMQEEFDLLLHGCIQCGLRAEKSVRGRLPIVRFPDPGITLARGGIGKAQFALQTQHLLDTAYGWGLVICAGAAGALVDGLAVGDVVVATSTVEHDYNNRFTSRPVPGFEGASSAIADLRRVSLPSDLFKVHFGIIASGDEDIVDGIRRDQLQRQTGALAVAWEGAGGARACAFSQVPFLEVRGITDAANRDAPSDFEANLKVAMNSLAVLILSWLKN